VRWPDPLKLMFSAADVMNFPIVDHTLGKAIKNLLVCCEHISLTRTYD
jgi:hypothetical protein